MFRIYAFAFVAGLAAAVFGAKAEATTFPAVTDNYNGTYTATAHNPGPGGHALWLPGLLGDTDWKFQNGSGLFSYEIFGGNALLTGQIVNDDGTGYFDVSIEFSFLQKGEDPGSAPKCELGGHCNSDTYDNPDGVSGYSDNFEYFNIVVGQATLTGHDALDGVTISLTQRPTSLAYPLQIGYSGDNKNPNEFGGSVWFFWQVTQNTQNVAFNNTSGHGDVNVLLSPVPIPAAGLLLFGAFAGLTFMRRRRST